MISSIKKKKEYQKKGENLVKQNLSCHGRLVFVTESKPQGLRTCVSGLSLPEGCACAWHLVVE